jgi:drug/metabolite transporter (DMT)-like permease
VSRRGWALFAAMSVIWGVPYLFIKVADTGVAVPVLVFARVGVGAAVLLPIAIRRGQVRLLAGHRRWLAAFAVTEIMLPWALLSDAERHLSSSLTGLLIAAVPVLGLLLARLTGGKERLTVGRWAGLLAGLGGVALLAAPHLTGGGAWPITEVILTALCYATGPLIADRKLADLPGLATTAVCLGAATLVYAPAAALTWPSKLPSAAVLGSLAALGLLCTATAFVLFFKLIAETGPTRAMVFTYVNPAVAVALGVAVLGEPLTPAIVAAFVLILAGSVLATSAGGPGRRAGPVRRGERAGGAEPARLGGPAGGAEPARRAAPIAGSAGQARLDSRR